MTLVRALVLGIALLAIPAVTAEDKKPAPKFDVEKFYGDYKITGGTKAGEKAGDDAKKGAVTVTKEKITLADGDMKFVFTYKIDDKAEPTAIDMEIVEPDAFKGTKAKGIIEMKDGKVTLCYHPMGGDRPKKAESTKDNGNYMFMMEKKEKKDK